MIFYDYWRSSSGWRVRIALNLKGVTVERRAVNLAGPGGGEQQAPAFRALNPMAQVPVLVLDEAREPGAPLGPRVLTQSIAILSYLELRFPSPPLLPAEPWLRGRAHQLAEIVNAGVQPFQNLELQRLLQASGVAEPRQIPRHYIAGGLAAFEAFAGETAGRFALGDAPTLADVYLVPQLYGARRFAVDLTPFPTLLRIEAACQALPAFANAHPDRQPDAPATPGA